MLSYKCHTWLESCSKCGFFGKKSFVSPLILWAAKYSKAPNVHLVTAIFPSLSLWNPANALRQQHDRQPESRHVHLTVVLRFYNVCQHTGTADETNIQ